MCNSGSITIGGPAMKIKSNKTAYFFAKEIPVV